MGTPRGTQTYDFIDLFSLCDTSLKDVTEYIKEKIAYYLGLNEHEQVRNETMETCSKIDMDSISNLNCNVYLSERKIVTSFVKRVAANLTDKSLTEQNTEHIEMYKFCKTVENIMNLSVVNSVLPVHFRESLIEFSIVHSELALKIASCASVKAS